jgi:hypothetical protein
MIEVTKRSCSYKGEKFASRVEITCSKVGAAAEPIKVWGNLSPTLDLGHGLNSKHTTLIQSERLTLIPSLQLDGFYYFPSKIVSAIAGSRIKTLPQQATHFRDNTSTGWSV